MFTRHDLVWLTAAGWEAAQAAALPEHVAAIDLWHRQDWPAIVRRSDTDAGLDQVCLGIALAPDPVGGDKVRIALRASIPHVARCTPPLTLDAVSAFLPDAWQSGLGALAGLNLRVYGSVAMQALTGLPYVGPGSDIDLLFYPTSRSELERGLGLLTKYADVLPLDGEIVFPDGAAVAWKEWRNAQTHEARVLVKDVKSVRLAPTRALTATLGQA